VTRFLLDTDTVSLYLRNHPPVCGAIVAHRGDELLISVITVEELWDGWQAVIRKAKTPPEVGAAYTRLADTLNELRSWSIVPFTTPAVERYAGLKKQKLNVGAGDLKIAAIGLETGAVVVTRNARDFRRVPGLTIEDWSGS
jgi:tRNA(fMet)-specific endonuclease VapC